MALRRGVNLCALVHELLGLLFHPPLDGFVFGDLLFGGVLAHVFRDLHGAEVRAAHGAEVGTFSAFLREGFIVEFAGGFGIEAEVELILPTEFEARFA